MQRLAARAPSGLRGHDVSERAHVRRAGNLYVTDSFGGAVWRFPLVDTRRHPAYRTGRPWAEHELLAPAVDDPLGFPLPGANGIGFDRPNRLYVANTEKGLVAQVPINRDGSAGEAVAVATGLATADGLAVDARGGVHVVIPGHAILGTSPLVLVDPRTGNTTAGVAPDEWGEFDVPLSLAFGTGLIGRASSPPTATFPASHRRCVCQAWSR